MGYRVHVLFSFRRAIGRSSITGGSTTDELGERVKSLPDELAEESGTGVDNCN